ncbi:MAG: hypothetical protein ACRDTC_08355 [Pseudonocardiaceae bacterium]
MKQPREQEGPHHLPHSEQERCAVEGRRIDGSGPCTVIAIRDRTQHGWVLYPHGNTGFGVLFAYDAAHTLAHRIGQPVMTSQHQLGTGSPP